MEKKPISPQMIISTNKINEPPRICTLIKMKIVIQVDAIFLFQVYSDVICNVLVLV